MEISKRGNNFPSPIIKVDGIEESIKEVNNTKYGLQTGTFTNNINKYLKVAKSIEAGSVILTKQSNYMADNMPFGGCKMGGIGK